MMLMRDQKVLKLIALLLEALVIKISLREDKDEGVILHIGFLLDAAKNLQLLGLHFVYLLFG